MKRTLWLLLALVFACNPAFSASIPGERLLSIFESRDSDGAMWRAFERVFPIETRAMFEEVSSKYAKGGSGSALEISAELIHRSQQLLWDNRRYVRSAPDDRLQAFAVTEAANLRDLQTEDVSERAYTSQYGGPPPVVTPASARVRIRTAIAELSLVEGGRDAPVIHATVSKSDISSVLQAAREAGTSPENLDAWEFGALWTRSPKDQCDTAIAIADALSKTSASQAGRFVEATLLGNDRTRSGP